MKTAVRIGLLFAAVGTLAGCGSAMSGMLGGDRGGETWNAATAVSTFQLGLTRGMSAGGGVATQQGGNAMVLDGAVTVGDHVVTFHQLHVTAQPYGLAGGATISGANAAELAFSGSASGQVTVDGATSSFSASMPPSFLIAAVTGEYVMHTLDAIVDFELGMSCDTALAPTLTVSTTDGGMDVTIDGSGYGLTFSNVTVSEYCPEQVTGTITFDAGAPDAITFVFTGDTVAISMGTTPIATVEVDDLECDLVFIQTDVWELLWTAQTLATDTAGGAAALCPNVTVTAGSAGSYTLDGSCDFPEPGTQFSQLTIVPSTLPVGTVGTAVIGDYPQLTLGFDGTAVDVQACGESIANVQLDAL